MARASQASEQNLRPRIPAPLPRPTATPTRKPVPKLFTASHGAAAGRKNAAVIGAAGTDDPALAH